jgi:hypothetical protein
MPIKNTYRHWVSKNIMDGYYHTFKSFKVYLAYRWYIAKQLDAKGFIMGTVNPLYATEKDIVYTNYAAKYE